MHKSRSKRVAADGRAPSPRKWFIFLGSVFAFFKGRVMKSPVVSSDDTGYLNPGKAWNTFLSGGFQSTRSRVGVAQRIFMTVEAKVGEGNRRFKIERGIFSRWGMENGQVAIATGRSEKLVFTLGRRRRRIFLPGGRTSASLFRPPSRRE